MAQTVADLPLQRTAFDPGPRHMSFVVDKSGAGPGFYSSISAFCVSILVPVLITYLRLNTTFTRRTSGRTWRTLNHINALSDVKEYWTEGYIYIVNAGKGKFGLRWELFC